MTETIDLFPAAERKCRRQRKCDYKLLMPESCLAGGCDPSTLPPERLKTLVAALLLLASNLCTGAALAFVNEVAPRRNPLPDLVFSLVPLQEWAWPLSDALVLFMGLLCGFSMMLHRWRWIVLRRIFLIAAMLYFFRALAMITTWMPLSDTSMYAKCIQPSGAAPANALQSIDWIDWSTIFRRTLKFATSFGLVGMEDDRVLCGDYIYSGHTLMYILCTLTIRAYMPRTGFYRLLQTLYPLGALVGMICVIVSRLHYTIDVLIAYWMTCLTFWCYHALLAARGRSMQSPGDLEQNRPAEADDDDSPRTNGLGFFDQGHLFQYFEGNIPPNTVIPREMDWPFSRPSWLCTLVTRLNEPTLLAVDD